MKFFRKLITGQLKMICKVSIILLVFKSKLNRKFNSLFQLSIFVQGTTEGSSLFLERPTLFPDAHNYFTRSKCEDITDVIQ